MSHRAKQAEAKDLRQKAVEAWRAGDYPSAIDLNRRAKALEDEALDIEFGARRTNTSARGPVGRCVDCGREAPLRHGVCAECE